MSVKVCGTCRHFATTQEDKRKGSCMAFRKQIDGCWDYHPERESNRYACGFFDGKSKEDEDGNSDRVQRAPRDR